MSSRIVQRGARHLMLISRRSPLSACLKTENRLAPATAHSFQSSFEHHVRFFSDASTKPEEDKNQQEEEEEPTETNEQEPAEERKEEEESREEQLEKEVKQLKDQLLRALAEQENTRRIAKKDVESSRQFAIKSFAKSLLDTSDNLERALDAVPEDLRNDKEVHPVLATLYEGIQMTDQGLIKAFESNGLIKYGDVGEPFDPNKHDALFEYPDPEQKPGTLGQVMKKGFMLNDRVLRPAEVGVIKKE